MAFLINLIVSLISGVICAFVVIDINERIRIKEHRKFTSEVNSMIQEEFKRNGLPDPFEEENNFPTKEFIENGLVDIGNTDE